MKGEEGSVGLLWFPPPSCLPTVGWHSPKIFGALPPSLVIRFHAPRCSSSWANSFLPRCLLRFPKLEAGLRSSLNHSLKPFLTITLQPSAHGQPPYTCFPSWAVLSPAGWTLPPTGLSCSVTWRNLLWPTVDTFHLLPELKRIFTFLWPFQRLLQREKELTILGLNWSITSKFWSDSFYIFQLVTYQSNLFLWAYLLSNHFTYSNDV